MTAMRNRLRTRRRVVVDDLPVVDINTTPLIDVMLVLLVMIIITIPVQLHAVDLHLPVGDPPPAAHKPEVVQIDIAPAGGLLLEELLARVRAHLRRVNPAVTGEVRVADLVMNLDGREIFRGGRRVELSAKEFELLELLARNPGKVFSRFEIEEKVWPEYTGGSNVVDVYIGYLRRKLEESGERRLIHTVRGVGYVLREE